MSTVRTTRSGAARGTSCSSWGSLLPALLTGVAVGNIYAGIPLDANGDYTGIPLLGLVTPFTLLCGLLGLSVFLTQGATWLSLKAPKGSDLRGRAAALRVPLGIVSLVLFVLVSVYGHFIIQPEMAPELSILRWLFALLFVVAVAAMIAMAKKGESGDLAAFLCSSASAVVLVGLLAASMFPNLVVNTAGENITIATAASLRPVARVDDGHHVRGPAARTDLPCDHLPHVSRSCDRARGRDVLTGACPDAASGTAKRAFRGALRIPGRVRRPSRKEQGVIDKALFALPGFRRALAIMAVAAACTGACVIGQALSLATALTNLWNGGLLAEQAVWLAVFACCFLLRQVVANVQGTWLDDYAAARGRRAAQRRPAPTVRRRPRARAAGGLRQPDHAGHGGASTRSRRTCASSFQKWRPSSSSR